jgi:hypothetical protein
MEQTPTDPATWAHVTQVRVVSNIIVVQVGTKSKAVVERVCKQARRYVYSPQPLRPEAAPPHGPRLFGTAHQRPRRQGRRLRRQQAREAMNRVKIYKGG